jgi:hypothetical protein
MKTHALALSLLCAFAFGGCALEDDSPALGDENSLNGPSEQDLQTPGATESSGAAPRSGFQIGKAVVGFAPLFNVGSEPKAPTQGSLLVQAMNKLAGCTEITTSRYKLDASASALSVPVCATTDAVHFLADMDVDCDGKETAVCNKSRDAAFQPQTAAVDSTGKPLDAARVPYVVVPGVSTRFDYRSRGIRMGSLAAVFYNGKMSYGVVGDIGPTAIIGEASYAMASALGINPDPSRGGTGSGVTYLIFSGPQNVVTKLEDVNEARTKGEAALRAWLSKN